MSRGVCAYVYECTHRHTCTHPNERDAHTPDLFSHLTLMASSSTSIKLKMLFITASQDEQLNVFICDASLKETNVLIIN